MAEMGVQRVTRGSDSHSWLACPWLMAYSLKVTSSSGMVAGISTIMVKFQAGIQRWEKPRKVMSR